MTSQPSVADPREPDSVDVLLIVPGLNGNSSAAESLVDARLASTANGAPVERDDAANAFANVVATGRFEHRRTVSLPWEAELMICLDLMAKESASGAAIPAARLLYPAGRSTDAAERPADLRVVMADPIALTPGHDDATLTPPEALGLESAELDDLFAAVNDLLVDDGMALMHGEGGRHCLTGLDPSSLDTLPTHALARCDIGRRLPPAADAGAWRRLMTEIQMLWHAHPVNEQRAMMGKPRVNGIWFWGGAALPEPPADAPSVHVVADDQLAVALAAHAGVSSQPAATLQQALDEMPTGTLVIVDLSAYEAWLAADADALVAARRTIATRWIEPAAQALADGRVASLVVRSGDGHEASFLLQAPATMMQRLMDAWRSLVSRRSEAGFRRSG